LLDPREQMDEIMRGGGQLYRVNARETKENAEEMS
jgi:hypothetical protein